MNDIEIKRKLNELNQVDLLSSLREIQIEDIEIEPSKVIITEDHYNIVIRMGATDGNGVSVQKVIDEKKLNEGTTDERRIKVVTTEISRNGEVVEVLEGDEITARRTGYNSAVVIKEFSIDEPVVGFLGVGPVAQHTLIGMFHAGIKPSEIRYISRDKSRAGDFENLLSEYFQNANSRWHDINPENVKRNGYLAGLDLLVIAAPIASEDDRGKILKLEELNMLGKRAVIISLTGDGVQHNVDERFLEECDIIADNSKKVRETGESRFIGEREINSLREVYSGKFERSDKRLFYDSTGSPITDLAFARLIV